MDKLPFKKSSTRHCLYLLYKSLIIVMKVIVVRVTHCPNEVHFVVHALSKRSTLCLHLCLHMGDSHKFSTSHVRDANIF